MILELEIYAPNLFPGASVWDMPLHAAMPPPHARFASVTFSNQLVHSPLADLISRETIYSYSRCSCSVQIWINERVKSSMKQIRKMESLTIDLSVYNRIVHVRECIIASVPGVLVALKVASIKRCVGFVDVRNECLCDGVIRLYWRLKHSSMRECLSRLTARFWMSRLYALKSLSLKKVSYEATRIYFYAYPCSKMG
jgi:hypothetical protein